MANDYLYGFGWNIICGWGDRTGGKMWLSLGVLAIACVISSCFYRAGGQSQDKTANPKWIPVFMRKSWVRDWLCPAVFLGLILCFFRPAYLMDYVYILVYYGLSGAALSTYWDWLFGGVDNYYMHGFGCGLAGFALITFVPWYILLIRLIICTVGMGWWSRRQDVDYLEEFGRGVFFIL